MRVLDHDTEGGPQPILTLELRLGSGARWTLHQARGLNNRLPTPPEAQLLALWAAEVGVHLPAGGEVAPMSAGARAAARGRLSLHWSRTPRPPRATAPACTQMAVADAHRAAGLLARWTPAATRLHQQGLHRIAQLVGRAHTFLEAELRRLHDDGQSELVGTLEAGEVLPGVGALTLRPDLRPLFSARPEGMACPGLIAHRQVGVTLDPDLTPTEHFEALDLCPGKRKGEVRVTYHQRWGGPLTTTLTPELLRQAGLLGPGPLDDPWAPGIAARRQPAFRFLRSVLDEPLGSLERAATAATGQAGATLRDQLAAWCDAPVVPSHRWSRIPHPTLDTAASRSSRTRRCLPDSR